MGTVIFWILIALLVLALIASSAFHERRKLLSRREHIRETFGRKDDGLHDTDAFDAAPMLFEHKKSIRPEDFYLDGITANDLSLKDIYSRMNRCLTSPGSDYLYCRFLTMPHDKSEGEAIYESVESYLADKDKAVRLLHILDGYGHRSGTDEFRLISELTDSGQKSIIYDILPFAALVLAIVMIPAAPLPGSALALILLGVCVYTYFSGRRHMEGSLKGLALSLRLIGCAEELAHEGCSDLSAYSGLFRLKKGNFLIPYKDRTVSDPLSLIFDYVRMITHIDLIVFKLRLSSVVKHYEDIQALYEDVGRLDAVLAIASYLNERPFCRAALSDDNTLSATGLYHPLVSDPVCNDIETAGGVLVTGSNASGKSTFLKAVGLNTLFARSLGIAFASYFIAGAEKLYTSMAINDDIIGRESYYVVEARSIKRICDAASDGKILCIIDEVLRGTNTTERIAASSKILESLCVPNVLCFAATHDLELTYLLKDRMDLYCFTEEIVGDNVTFPFTIKKGISDRTNAIRLLSMMGFDRKIVDGADELVGRYNSTGKWS
ncbi:MAG: hypothetical protein K6G58_01595 [Lachnospiraceae bacterium]|nr:hypothetical protein [Lachnospiraceae bacterium]